MADATADIELALEAFKDIRAHTPSDSVAADLAAAAIIADARREPSTEHFDNHAPVAAFWAIRPHVPNDDIAAKLAGAAIVTAALREGATEAPWWLDSADYHHRPCAHPGTGAQDDNPSTREES